MYTLLSQRRSIRKFKSEKVDADTVELLIKSVLRSPSGRGINPWEFIYVDDPALLKSLSQAKPGGAQPIAEAPQALVVMVDTTKTALWIENGSIALTIAHLAAASLGLGSCWIQMRDKTTAEGAPTEQYIRDLLHMEEKMRIVGILPFGYPDEIKAPHPEESLQLEKVHFNTYGKKYF